MSSEPSLPRELQEKYQAGIPGKIAEIERLAKAFRVNKTKVDLEALRLIVHKMAGSAALYGYQSVSGICHDWDEKLVKKIEKFSSEDVSWVGEIDTLIKKVKEGFHFSG